MRLLKLFLIINLSLKILIKFKIYIINDENKLIVNYKFSKFKKNLKKFI